MVGVLPAESEQLAQQLAPDRVGRGARVGLAGGAQHLAAAGFLVQLAQHAGLADAGLADDLDQGDVARPDARGSAARSASISSLRPISGRFAAVVAATHPLGGPSDHACTGLALPLT